MYMTNTRRAVAPKSTFISMLSSVQRIDEKYNNNKCGNQQQQKQQEQPNKTQR